MKIVNQWERVKVVAEIASHIAAQIVAQNRANDHAEPLYDEDYAVIVPTAWSILEAVEAEGLKRTTTEPAVEGSK